ncbi:uncharacterized protein LOC133302203 [Gastrolobium bilobum]|uniref:uncharacterized protein LOC133302203 n=1 Tax=Gastrolobium bilobum TaxID=150636 RepID=UPI002AB05ED2|nr:uncharacterized protein LOC133302203 [Gastrolobium bilobum]
MEMFKKLQINIPFSKALENMPLYAKFMKGLLSNRHKLREMETVALTEESRAVIKNGLSSKVKDPGRFSIPCTIRNVKVGRALCGLGASVNLMPLSFARSLGITEMKSTLMSLQFADRSIKRPEGVLEDVLVKVNDYIFPADFVMLNMKEDDNMPLILGRPFLATAKILIDVEKRQMIFRVNDGEFNMHIFEAMKQPEDKEDGFQIDVIEEAVSEKIIEEANPFTIEDHFADILHSSELLNDDQLTKIVKAID